MRTHFDLAIIFLFALFSVLFQACHRHHLTVCMSLCLYCSIDQTSSELFLLLLLLPLHLALSPFIGSSALLLLLAGCVLMVASYRMEYKKLLCNKSSLGACVYLYEFNSELIFQFSLDCRLLIWKFSSDLCCWQHNVEMKFHYIFTQKKENPHWCLQFEFILHKINRHGAIWIFIWIWLNIPDSSICDSHHTHGIYFFRFTQFLYFFLISCLKFKFIFKECKYFRLFPYLPIEWMVDGGVIDGWGEKSQNILTTL